MLFCSLCKLTQENEPTVICRRGYPILCADCFCLYKQGKNGPLVSGVGPDAPIVENSKGGKQSSCPYRADLLPAKACLEISKVLKHGADKYGVDNWRKISRADNLNHAMVHILAYLAGDRSDEHLAHAGCRILFAMETE